MKLDYSWRKTKEIEDYLQRLAVAKKVIDILPRFPYLEENLRRQSLLKSSLFSARIEGNRLQLKEVQSLPGKRKEEDLAKIEVFNILKALRFLHSPRAPKKITKKLILQLHRYVLDKISPSTGHFRQETSGIFNQAGVAVYLAPPPEAVPRLIAQLIRKNNQSKNPGPIKAAIFHFGFEKIHPFLDGNGRVGRLLATLILKNSGFDFRGLISPEEYLEKHRQVYYRLLAISQKDITDFVEFFLEATVTQAEKAIDELKNVGKELPGDRLRPRRREILAIIRDHQIVSFNFIKRRFIKVADSTLHYDLQQLIKEDFIKKLGTTRGALYALKKT